MDGEEYNTKGEASDKPHPNCKCRVERIEEDRENFDEDKMKDNKKGKSTREKLKKILIDLKSKQKKKEVLKNWLNNYNVYIQQQNELENLQNAQIKKQAIDWGMNSINNLLLKTINDIRFP